jgi:lysophospholipase L1-like esterase
MKLPGVSSTSKLLALSVLICAFLLGCSGCSSEEPTIGGLATSTAGTGGAASAAGGSSGEAQAGGSAGVGGSLSALAGSGGTAGAAGLPNVPAGGNPPEGPPDAGPTEPERYNPCPTDGSPCRIMPLGDSITAGAGSSHGGSYRADLFRLAHQEGRLVTFVGSQQGGPETVDEVAFPRDNEGHSGWTIDDGGGRMGLYPQMLGWLDMYPPHIVTLMIGTNDVNIELDLTNAMARLGLLLDRIASGAPDALVVIAQIVPTTDDSINQRVVSYNVNIPTLVAERVALGRHIEMVDMYGAFVEAPDYKTAYMNDTLHPRDEGYVIMANVWYDQIRDLLPTTP